MSKIVILKSGSQACLNPLHSGFAHGFGIFETMRITGGRLEFWQAHCERFLHSAKVFNLHGNLTEAAILAAIRKLVQSEKLRDGVVKLSLLSEGAESCCYVYSRSIKLPDESVRLQLNTQSVLNERSVLAGHKTHNYMEAMHLKQLAKSVGYFDQVRVNTAGFLTETSVANLFFVKDNILYTPALSTGILPGVIRAEVLKAARTHSIPVEEGHYPANSLITATTVFITNSSTGIVPVCSLTADDFDATYTIAHPLVDTLQCALDDAREHTSTLLKNEQIA